MNNVNKSAKRLRKNLKNKISIPNLITYLETLGYSTVFFNTMEGDTLLKSYGLSPGTTKAFTYCGTTQIVFLDNNLPTQDKIYSLLHEMGHILLCHIGDNKIKFLDKRLMENEAEAFAYTVLNYKRNYKPLYFAICLVLASVISATAGYNLHSDDTPPPEQYNVPISNSITPATEPTETQAPVINENNTGFVYVTKTGTQYHKANCQYVRNNNTATAIKADEANKRYTPCRVCNPN